MSETRKANIRFDMDNEMHRQAWQLLQDRDKNKYTSYSQTVAAALIELLSEKADENKAVSIDPALLAEISETVAHATEKAIARTLPSFLAGYMACAAGFSLNACKTKQISFESMNEEPDDEDAADDIDFDFLGLN